MAKVRGREEVKRFLAELPAQLEAKVLRGAARAAAKVVRDEAKLRSISDLVAQSLKIASKHEDGRIVAKVQARGKGAFMAPWLEYGTDAHFISVSDDDRQGMSVNRINRLQREGSLAIGGKLVGPSVHHPGAQAHPFLRPSLDTKEADAIAAAQTYINARVGPAGITGTAEPEGDDA